LAGTAGNIHFLGYRRGESLQELYRGAVALLVPSLCYEVFPTVILEAFQHGTPVIARDLGGMREMVDESHGGLLFRDDAALVRACQSLLDGRSHRDHLGGSGREACARIYSKEAYLARYYELIEQYRTRGRASKREAAASAT
jgi:glycosyltransferase involved in cell wall biosynthesis